MKASVQAFFASKYSIAIKPELPKSYLLTTSRAMAPADMYSERSEGHMFFRWVLRILEDVKHFQNMLEGPSRLRETAFQRLCY